MNNGLGMDLFGIQIVESSFCERNVPKRKHKHRRNQSAAYHLRVQKKWIKRFGTRKERFALMMNPGVLGLAGGDMVMLRNLTNTTGGQNNETN